MARIYLASSWRNPFQPEVRDALRTWGHAVYDFRKDTRQEIDVLGPSEPPATAFSWSEVDSEWRYWEPAKYRYLLQSSARCAQGYIGDLRGMEWANTCVLCLPAGNSAHTEAGYMKGKGKRLIIYWHNNNIETRSDEGNHQLTKPGNDLTYKEWKFEPDLMYLLADNLCIGLPELKHALDHGT